MKSKRRSKRSRCRAIFIDVADGVLAYNCGLVPVIGLDGNKIRRRGKLLARGPYRNVELFKKERRRAVKMAMLELVEKVETIGIIRGEAPPFSAQLRRLKHRWGIESEWKQQADGGWIRTIGPRYIKGQRERNRA